MPAFANPSGFGHLLQHLMKSGAGTPDGKRWTDEALAATISVETASIANWRRERSQPTRKHYVALLSAFGLDRDNSADHEVITALDEALQKGRPNVKAANPQFVHFATAFPTTLNRPVDRDVVDEWLDKAVLVGPGGLCCIVASGGSGKSTSVWAWVSKRVDELRKHYESVFIWSFYRQGQTAEFVSVDLFFDSLGQFLSLRLKPNDPTRSKIHTCLDALADRRILIVVDGIESLQYPPGDEISRVGRFKDSDVQEFFSSLAGLRGCTAIVTSRISITIGDRLAASRTSELRLDNFTAPEALAVIRSYGIEGSDPELMPYVRGCRGHPLTLALVANFIRRAYKHRLPSLEEISLNAPSGTPEAGLAERVLESYLGWLPPPEAALLTLCGVFDQPISATMIYRLVTALIGETDVRVDLLQNYRSFRFHLETLKVTELIYDDDVFVELVDAHPIIKDYLGSLLRKKYPNLWKAANCAMFSLLDEFQDGNWALRRIVFGCRGGIYQRAFDEVYEPRFSKSKGTFSDASGVSYGNVLHALNAFFEHGSASGLEPTLDGHSKLILLLDAISLITALRGYADPQLPILFESAARLTDVDDSMLWRVKYAECRFHRMAGNLSASKGVFDRLLERGERTGDKSFLVGGYRNAAAYYFYVANFDESKRLAQLGETVGYQGEWTKDPLGFVNNPNVMLAGYTALNAAMLGLTDVTANAVVRMNRICERDNDIHSRAIAALIEAMLSDFGYGSIPLLETACSFERLATQGELTQWLIAANIFRAAACTAPAAEFDRLMRRWIDTGARLFVPYWCALAGESCERAGDLNGVHNFSARGLAMARSTSEVWTNPRLIRLSRLA